MSNLSAQLQGKNCKLFPPPVIMSSKNIIIWFKIPHHLKRASTSASVSERTISIASVWAQRKNCSAPTTCDYAMQF